MRIGVVGVGHLGSAHARIWREIPEAQLVGVYDTSRERAQEIADLHDCRVFPSIEHTLDQVDAVSIVTPTPVHLETALPFLEAGKAVLVEKPLAATLEQADQICQAARESGAVLQVGHIERFNPVIRAAIHLVEKPVFIECDRIHPFSLRSTEISVVNDLMIHDIDIALHLIDDDLVSVDAHGCAVLSPYEDLAHARLSFARGATAIVKTSRVALNRARKVRIFGPNQYVSLDLVQQQGFHVSLDANYDPSRFLDSAGRIEAPDGVEDFLSKHLQQSPLSIEPTEPLRAELESFLGAANRQRQPAVTGIQGRRAMEAATQVIESLRERANRLEKA
ncbi:MAG: Gfo/Idh/MocA family oxidoreductase [Planctomycetota bacterium]